MARPGLMRHRKFTKLARLLMPHARHFHSEISGRGVLEVIWEACYEAGDAKLGSAEDVEHMAKWKGAKGHLATILYDAGFLDISDDGTYSVHDLLDHAPDYVRRRCEREEERKLKGKTLSELRSKAGRKGRRKQLTGKCPATDEQTSASEIH